MNVAGAGAGNAAGGKPLLLGMSRYQWTVLFAAWLGWGFDIFDGILFNFVAPNCIPTLLHLPTGSPEAAAAIKFWTGVLTALLLIGWAIGGLVFGFLCDRLGRLRTLMLTMLMFAVGTALCAAATNLWMLIAFRLVASLGIGGEWAAGSAMVAEVVPDKRRVEAGALLYTAAPFGLFLATLVNKWVARDWFPGSPEVSWRYVFLFGLLPAAVAFIVRLFVREPERWQASANHARAASLRQIFTPAVRRYTLWGTVTTLFALVTWWSTNAFLPAIATGLARTAAKARELDPLATLKLVEDWKTSGMLWFNLGGLIGTLLVIPAAKLLGRRWMFAIYFACSSVAMLSCFGLDLPPEQRLKALFWVGVPVFGVYGAFPFYLPELFPTWLRATGAGFCYNIGRVLASAGVFWVGWAAARGEALHAVFWVAFVPLIGVLLSPYFIETRHASLPE